MACRDFLKAELAARKVGMARGSYTVMHLDLASLERWCRAPVLPFQDNPGNHFRIACLLSAEALLAWYSQ